MSEFTPTPTPMSVSCAREMRRRAERKQVKKERMLGPTLERELLVEKQPSWCVVQSASLVYNGGKIRLNR